MKFKEFYTKVKMLSTTIDNDVEVLIDFRTVKPPQNFINESLPQRVIDFDYDLNGLKIIFKQDNSADKLNTILLDKRFNINAYRR